MACGFLEYVFGQSVTGEYYDSDILNEIGSDVVLIPDPNTRRLVPWYDEPTAQIIHDAVSQDGRLVPFCGASCSESVFWRCLKMHI